MSAARETIDFPAAGVGLLGLPLDCFSSYRRGAARAPAVIRKLLCGGMSHWTTESGLNLKGHPRWRDLGDLPLSADDSAIETIGHTARRAVAAQTALLGMGGDHAVTYPLAAAWAERFPRLTLLHFDAHPDLYDRFGGSPFSHACPFARLLESYSQVRLVQVGVRAFNRHQREQAERFGVETIEMRHWPPAEMPIFEGPLYISIDLDVFDPAYAPGVSHHEPGGLTPRQCLDLLQGVTVPVVGADIVELNPSRDPSGITAALAAKLVKEVAGLMLTTTPAQPEQWERLQ
ncbi:MAG: agmatinase [Desulfosarcinaceae bacterium]|nr:agmatinase [Desulfosarcinaceae bacterium]